jgi:beta-xylosidase
MIKKESEALMNNTHNIPPLPKKIWVSDQGNDTYQNPVLYADYSDPDAIRVGEDYFLIASSFCNVPAIPLLHSKDLINWQVINYCMDTLPSPKYDTPQHGCGIWAPSIRYHEGTYYVFAPMPDEGILVCHTTDPWGKWSKPSFIRQVTGWIDPCPFWDDDGSAYMVNAFARSRIGFKSYLYMSPIKPDCSDVLDDGQFIYDGHATQPTIEGPKLYKRNGFYYIFAPAGGVKTGWQTVLRSKHIYGPYEEKIVMHQGNSPVNGPHQGAWVDTPTGEDWFLHFQDAGNAGRILHLQPMRWVDDWPIIGVKPDASGCGEPVITYKKPNTGSSAPQAIYTPQDSDDFSDEILGLQWQWNANPRPDWYRLSDNQLRLYSQPISSRLQLCDVPNLLLQKWPAPSFYITAHIHLDHLMEGDAVGMVSLGGCYTALLVCKKGNCLHLQQRTGKWLQNDEILDDLGTWDADGLCLRMLVEKSLYISFEIGEEEHWIPIGNVTEATPGRWVGVKAGLVAFHEDTEELQPSLNQSDHELHTGYVDVDYFLFHKLLSKSS